MTTTRPEMRHALRAALEAAANDWLMGVSEADRSEGGRLDTMFRVSGFSPANGVPKDPRAKVKDWCGMAVVAWLIEGGMNVGLNTSFLHVYNVEDFFTYGRPRNRNPRRLDQFVTLGEGKETSILGWHKSERALRRWLDRAAVADGLTGAVNPDLFREGDVVLLDWSGRNDADHIAIVAQWDAAEKRLHTWEGNVDGLSPTGEPVQEAVVPRSYDLAGRDRRLIYGVGRLSPLDFGVEAVR